MGAPADTPAPPGSARTTLGLMGRFLPAAIVLSLLLAWLRVEGERAGFFGTYVGTALFAGTTITLFSVLVWFYARMEVRSHEALRRSEQRMRLIIDSAYDAFIAMDVNGQVIDWNPQAEK